MSEECCQVCGDEEINYRIDDNNGKERTYCSKECVRIAAITEVLWQIYYAIPGD